MAFSPNPGTIDPETNSDFQFQYLETILNHLPVPVIITEGDDLTIRLFNSAYQAIGPGKQMVGKTVTELWPELGPEVPGTLRRVLRTGKPFHTVDHPYNVRRYPEGPLELGYFSWSAYRLRLPGDRWGVLCTVWETTERKRVEDALHQSGEHLSLALDASRAGIWEWDLETGENRWSDQMWELYGIEPYSCQPSYDTWLQALIPEDRESAERITREAARNGKELNLEFRVRSRDGSERCLLARGRPLRDATGRPARYLGIVLDVTARKRAEQELLNSEQRRILAEALQKERERLEQILDSLPVMVCLLTPDHQVSFANRRFREMFGESGGQHCYEYLFGGSKPCEECQSFVPLQTNTAHHWEWLTPGPKGRYLDIYDVPFTHPDGSRGILEVDIDITERRLAEERLREKQKLESIGLLASGIAHDFNNLLVGVIGNATLVRQMLPRDSDIVPRLNRVIEGGEQLAHLTRQLLAYSGKSRSFSEPLELSALVPEMARLVEPAISSKVSVHFDLGRDLPLVEADRGQMQQVFMNLLLNAAEAIGSEGGQITVRTGVQEVNEPYMLQHPKAADLRRGRYVFLEIRDSGCGMDPETQAKIFDPFFTTKFVGRGLGLAAVAGIVRTHQGAILVDSAPGKGSRFTILLPALEEPFVFAPPAEDGALESRGTGTILIVDDDEAVREMAQKALEFCGYHVLTAGGSEEAITMCKSYPDDIAAIILDLTMPGRSGNEVLPELRKIRPSVEVLVSSGYDEVETMALFSGLGVAGFIQKPYTLDGLVGKVGRVLRR